MLLDIAAIIGLIIGFGGILAGFKIEGGAFSGLWGPSAFMIVFGGTIGATLISFPLSEIKKLPSLFKGVFQDKKLDEEKMINILADLADKARRDGLLVLEQEVEKIENPLLKKGLGLVVDGIDGETIKDILSREVYLFDVKVKEGAEIFEAAGGYGPTMGIVGTVMGMVSILGNLGNSEELGSSIAAAFIATLYGISSANLLWLPFAKKLKVKGKKEKMVNEIIVEGLLSIQAGENPRVLKEKLNSIMSENKKSESSAEKDDSKKAEA
jgi:chemotaxis protein MotA